MANPAAVTLHASAAESTSDTGAAIDIGETRSALQVALAITAVSGTAPALTVTIQTAPSTSGPWRPAWTIGASAMGRRTTTLAELDRFVRATWAIGGDTPSFTFELSGTAHTLYAGPSDLTKTGIKAEALQSIEAVTLAECCIRASSDAETALNSAYTLPLSAWGDDLRGHCASRAVFYAMNQRGRAPNDQGVDSLIDRMGGFMLGTGVKSAAQGFFDGVARGVLKPIGIVDQTPDEYEGAGYVASGPSRW